MMLDPRFDKLADVLVKYSVKVKKDDVVRIRMATVAEPLALALYRRIIEAGGHPVLRLASEECAELLVRHGKQHQLAFESPYEMHEAETLNADISAWAHRNTKAMSNANSKKMAVIQKARQPVFKTFLKRIAAKGKNKIRWVGTQFPSHAAAQDAEMSLTEYADFVFNAGMLHKPNPIAEWKKISTAQQRLADFLNKASEVRYIHRNGTDVRFGVKGRTWINCDGQLNFPDGEVFTGPIETATEGVVVFNFPGVLQSREVHDIRLEFKSGKVVNADAGKGRDFLYSMIDQDKGGRTLGELAIGTNYNIQRHTRNTLFDEKIGGSVHMALGASLPGSGGKNVSALHWDLVLDMRNGGTIEVDGKVISKNGRFTRASWPQPTGRRRK